MRFLVWIGAMVAVGLGLVQAVAADTTRTYSWVGDLVASDPAAKTLTVKVRIPPHVAKYARSFKADGSISTAGRAPSVPPPRRPAG